MLFFGISVKAAPGINETVSFQGRLLNGSGNPVAEGYYNIQFKLYQDGTGTTAGNSGGTLEWTETYINDGGSSGVYVKNGYFSVNLGSQNPFGSQVDWNQDTLWLSMNVAGSSASCTTFGSSPCLADGEMLPMKRLTSAPYALNSGRLNGMTSDDLIHNGTTQQTANFNISGTGIANILQGTSSVVAPLLDRSDAGLLSIGTTNATSIQIGSATADQTISLGSGSGNNTLTIGSTSGTSSLTLQGGSNGVAINSSGGFVVQGGANPDPLAIDSSGNVSIGLTSSTEFTIKNSSDDTVALILDDGSATFDGTVVGTSQIGAISTDTTNSVYLSAGNSGASALATNSNTLALQGNSMNLLTAVNNGGVANIGIGNDGSAGYALDVTGSTNVSADYKINGVSVLNTSGLNFSAASTAEISAASGQVLQLTGEGGVRVGDGVDDAGDPTLLTLDQSDTTPTATILGSMYYDTTLGKVQCYEADGWGACSSSPDNFVTLSPEYTNAVTNGTGTGTFTSDICSDTLNINDGSSSQPTICGTNETYNFYKWTTTETSAQTKDIYVTYQLPSNFTGFVDGSTSLVGRTDDNSASVAYQVYKNTSSGLVACGSSVSVSTGLQTTWQKVSASGSADPANCSFSAGDSLVFKITMSSTYTTVNTNAYVSTLSFAFQDD